MVSNAVPDSRNDTKRIGDNTSDISRAIIDDTKVFEITSPEIGLAAGQGSNEGSAAGNYLSKSGDIRLGPMGNDFKIVVIANDEINVSVSTANYVPFIILNPEGGLADNLDTILPGTNPFFHQELFLQNGNISVDITLKNAGASGNIVTPDGNDLAISFGQIVKLVYSQLLSGWVVVWVSSGSGGGGGVSFPIRPPVLDNGTVSTNQVMNLALTTGHVNKYELTGDIQITFSNPPTNDIQQEFEVEIKQDGTGGHSVTFPQVTNQPDIQQGIGDITIITFRTNDGGTTYRIGNTINVQGGGTGSLAGLSDVNLGVLADDNLLAFNFATSQWINQTASQAGVAQGDLNNLASPTSINQSLLFSTTGLDIGDTTNPVDQFFVNTVRLQNDLLVANKPSMTSLTGNTFDVNFPTGSTFNIHENGSSKHTFTASSLTSPNIIISAILAFNDFVTDPVSNGQITRNGVDVKVFSGNAVRNMSNIGVAAGGADVNLSNLASPTAINQDLLFSTTGFNVGDTTNPVDQLFTGTVRLQTNLLTANKPSMTSLTGNTFDVNFPTGSTFNIHENGSSKHTFSASSLTSPNIIVNQILAFNDNSGDPVSVGQIRRNGADVKVFSGGVVKNFSDIGTGSFLPLSGGTMSGPIDMNNNDLQGVDDINFNISSVSIITAPGAGAGGGALMSIDVPDGTLRIRFNSTTRFQITSAGVSISGNSTPLGFFGNTPVSQQSVASDTLANLYTALRNYGLIS